MNEILSDDDLFSLTEMVWSTMLGLEVTRGNETDSKIGDVAITACVQITGEWDGAVTVACGPRLAYRAASNMFQLDTQDLDDDMVRDAMGEVGNMTGGNVKGIAPGFNTLTLPTVTEGDEGAFSIPRVKRFNRVVGLCDGEPLIVSVFGREG